MITNIFKRVSIKSIITSFFLTYLAFFFDLNISNPEINLRLLIEKSLILTIAIMIFNLIIAYNELKKLNIRLGSEYLISFPICIFLFYHDAGTDYQKVLMGIMILLSLNIYSRDFTKFSIPRSIFSLGIIFTIMSFVNINLSLFFFLIIFLLKYMTNFKKAIISLILSVIVTLQLLLMVTYLKTGKFLYQKPKYFSENISTANFSSENEFIWITVIFMAFLIAIFQMKNNKVKFLPQNRMLSTFMIFWLAVSVIFRYFNLYSGEGKWSMSLIPTAYFIGILIKEIKKDFWRDILVYSLIFIAVSSKFYFTHTSS